VCTPCAALPIGCRDDAALCRGDRGLSEAAYGGTFGTILVERSFELRNPSIALPTFSATSVMCSLCIAHFRASQSSALLNMPFGQVGLVVTASNAAKKIGTSKRATTTRPYGSARERFVDGGGMIAPPS